jgi:hypothetical protein
MSHQRMGSMLRSCALLLILASPVVEAGENCCHVLLCCRSNNAGSTFLVAGKWLPAHSYLDIDQVRDIMQSIQSAGIHTVILDMTNAGMWVQWYENEYKVEIGNIVKVCEEKDMQFAMHIGNSASQDMKWWNGIAKRIWDTWAQAATYRKYGYGDKRPLLIYFSEANRFWDEYGRLAPADRDHLAKFHIGTVVVNVKQPFGESDGWGYRQTFQNTSGSVRFASTTSGFAPTDPWVKISRDEWIKRVTWAKAASEYSIYGSYDDMCDGISFGIANTDKTTTAWNVYPDRDPYAYYTPLKSILTAMKP